MSTSLKHSASTSSSTSSTATTSTVHPNEQQIDPSNILYNDRQHYQIIFTNDSRFFDTSLHLYKSYCELDYIKNDKKKSRKSLFSSSTNTLKPLPNGIKNSSRPKSIGFSSNDILRSSTGTLKPPFPKIHDRSIPQRSDSSSSRLRNGRLPLVVSDQRESWMSNPSNTNDDSSDDPDVIVTRL